MTRHSGTMPSDYFERMFQGTADPWDLDSSPYEKAKYDHSIATLAGRTYTQGFEVGCAKGTFTQRLALHCRALLAVDVSETALQAARMRCAAHDGVRFDQMAFPEQVPSIDNINLLILSEVVYYWDDADIWRAADWIATHLAPGGDILLVHWTGETDYPQSGDGAVSKLHAALGPAIAVRKAERCPHYRLDLWRWPS